MESSVKQKRKKPECCLVASLAIEKTKEYIASLPEDKRRIFLRLKEIPQPMVLNKKYLIWVMACLVSAKDKKECLILYVEVKSSRVLSAYIKLDKISDVENNQRYENGRFIAYFQDGSFNVIKNSTYMTLEEAEQMWEREKEKHLPRLQKSNFTFLDKITPSFCGQTPIYMIAYSKNHCDNNIEVLCVYPNCSKLFARSYTRSNWRQMQKQRIGSFITMANKKIMITQIGFEVELL